MLSVCGSRQLLVHAQPSFLVQHFIERRHRTARTSSTMVLAIDSNMFICMHSTQYSEKQWDQWGEFDGHARCFSEAVEHIVAKARAERSTDDLVCRG